MTDPKVILNAAMTLDGKISAGKGEQISGEEDLDRVHQLRAESDAVMVGIGTVLADDPRLTVRRVEGTNPCRIVVDSRGRTPLDANVMDRSAETYIVVSKSADEEKINGLSEKGATVLRVSETKRGRIDLGDLVEELSGRGIDLVLLEGGSTLNWSMLYEGLVDEIRVAIGPKIVGGRRAKTLVGGEGFESISDSIRLNLKGIERVGKDVLLTYETVKQDD